jgi:hypothetical protein
VRSDGGINWGFVVQAILMTGGGVGLLALAGTDFWKYRDAESLLLLVWVFGTYIFASFITWTINVRYLLPIAPGAGILLMRRINRSGKIGQSLGFWRFSWPLLPAAVISISVSWADYTLANTARSAATTIDGRYKSYEGTVWFQGHWGFQYYMENNGHKAHDIEDNTSVEGDVLVIPVNNYKTWLSAVQAKGIRPISTFEFVCCRWLATMSRKSGAGFYIDGSGVLPYTLGPVDLERYYVFAVR